MHKLTVKYRRNDNGESAIQLQISIPGVSNSSNL